MRRSATVVIREIVTAAILIIGIATAAAHAVRPLAFIPGRMLAGIDTPMQPLMSWELLSLYSLGSSVKAAIGTVGLVAAFLWYRDWRRREGLRPGL
jgi:hypothetical protein